MPSSLPSASPTPTILSGQAPSHPSGKPQETPLPVGGPAALGAALHSCCGPHPRHGSQTDSPSLEGSDCAMPLAVVSGATWCGAHSETVADSDELIELMDRLSLSSNTT